jgi:hypothetical protein
MLSDSEESLNTGWCVAFSMTNNVGWATASANSWEKIA